ncbi:MFS transporter [Amycolatopsis sp. NPDC023774]|uniref:MFS transporter n=1 Tax=Amycolatopsis sp. NPDC023774 TaxID=3155015 RepID=UPI003407DBE0
MSLGSGVVSIVGTVGAAVSGAATSPGDVPAVMGIGVGVASVVVPMYLSEPAPKEVRGKLTSLMRQLVTVGILVAYVAD